MTHRFKLPESRNKYYGFYNRFLGPFESSPRSFFETKKKTLQNLRSTLPVSLKMAPPDSAHNENNGDDYDDGSPHGEQQDEEDESSNGSQ